MQDAFITMAILVGVAYLNNMIKYLLNIKGVLGTNKSLHNGMLE